jgi:hypothetical protein
MIIIKDSAAQRICTQMISLSTAGEKDRETGQAFMSKWVIRPNGGMTDNKN